MHCTTKLNGVKMGDILMQVRRQDPQDGELDHGFE